MRRLTLPLSKIQKIDRPLVGEKAYRLSELFKQDVSVPKAFVITTESFNLFLKEHFFEFLHQALTKDLSLADKAFFASQLKEKILKEEIPHKLRVEILERFTQFGFEKVSLRSSATVEDGKRASFAGQFETFLNISKDNLLEKIKACWASLFSPRVVVYTHKKKLSLKKIKMAVIVQKMVKPQLAGNLVTKNLLKNREKEILIEIAEGLGDKITAGTVTPEQIFIDKSSFSVTYHRLATRDKGLLSEDKAKYLSKLGLLIEQVFKIPQEIEWAIEKDKVFILQTRPLTI